MATSTKQAVQESENVCMISEWHSHHSLKWFIIPIPCMCIGLVLWHHHQFPEKPPLEDTDHELSGWELHCFRQWRWKQAWIHRHPQCMIASLRLIHNHIAIQEDGRWLIEWAHGRVRCDTGAVHGFMRESQCKPTTQKDCWLDHSCWQFHGLQEAYGQKKHRAKWASNEDDLRRWGSSKTSESASATAAAASCLTRTIPTTSAAPSSLTCKA